MVEWEHIGENELEFWLDLRISIITLRCEMLAALYIYIYIERERNKTLFMFTHIHTYIHTCIHAYMHAYMHTYIHMCTLRISFLSEDRSHPGKLLCVAQHPIDASKVGQLKGITFLDNASMPCHLIALSHLRGY